ncbi:MAG: AraC family transcriptional regulator [Acutalibacteraceae bacterium]|nr:AraC family transcriptional regulator [Acutalibacteraceae bacterium]
MTDGDKKIYKCKTVKRCIQVNSIVQGIDEERDKDFFFPGESHDFWEIVFVSEGEISATADERIYNLKQGMLLFHKPMEFHRLLADGKTPSHLKIISFTAKGELIKQFEKRCFNLSISEQDAFSEITDFFIKAYTSYSESPEEFYYLSNTAASLLENFLLKLRDKNEYTPKHITHSENIYYQIVKTMKNNIDKSLSVNDIAKLLSMSPSNIKRVFSIYSDIGIAKYFLNMRIRRAKELLNNGFSPCQVAKMLGFTQNYFYTVFKREVGISPKKYTNS